MDTTNKTLEDLWWRLPYDRHILEQVRREIKAECATAFWEAPINQLPAEEKHESQEDSGVVWTTTSRSQQVAETKRSSDSPSGGTVELHGEPVGSECASQGLA